MNVQEQLNKYTSLYSSMKINVNVDSTLAKMKAGKETYEAISNAMGGLLPWYFIACIHNMECSLNFNKHLHNGDPLAHRTVLVPAGRPIDPPITPNGYSFKESAIDALTMKGYQTKTSWTIEEMLYRLEKYNGWGYFYKGCNSPYLWAGTNQYTKGKYVADGVYDSEAVSKQIGSAIFIKMLP